MSRTQVRPSRDLRNHYAEVVRAIKHDGDHIIITNNGVGETVMIDFADYEGYKEYKYQQYIYNELQKSKALLDDPNVERIPAMEVFARIEKKLEVRRL